MLFSLLVAFIVTPWAAVRLLGRTHAHTGDSEDRLTAWYRRVMGPLIDRRRPRTAFLALVAALLAAAAVLVPTGLVTVKMLPFDNKSELQVMVRMPDDTPLETTAAVASALPGGMATPAWNTYVSVHDADVSLRRAAELGAEIVHEPTDAGPPGAVAGRWAALRAADGADLRVWQPGYRQGAQLVNAPGTWNSSDLVTADPDGAVAARIEVGP